MGFDGGMGLGGWLWVALAVAAVIGVVWLVAFAATSRERRATDEAGAILRGRFARGEISEAEYEQARRLLGI